VRGERSKIDILIARLLHIFAGVVWAGTVISFGRYVEPTVNEIGPSGQAFMQTLERRGFTKFMLAMAVTGILSGAYLYWRVSGGLQAAWIGSGFGLSITVGAITALAAFALGPIFYIPAGKRITEITKGAGPEGPSPEQRAELAGIGRRLAGVGKWSMVLLGITVLTMAGARYLDGILP
jgi:uncharacterized membrane protein